MALGSAGVMSHCFRRELGTFQCLQYNGIDTSLLFCAGTFRDSAARSRSI